MQPAHGLNVAVGRQVCNQSNNIFLGKKGQGLAIDTSRCLHYGSRDISNTRLVLLVQFCDPYASLYYKSELNNLIPE